MKQAPKRKLILASASPQRKKLLKKIGVPFQIVPSNVRETNPATVHHEDVRALVTGLALRKAKSIAKRFKNQRCLILGADTLVVCDEKILGKPRDAAHARAMLRTLSGRWQQVVTGLCFIATPEQKIRTGFAKTSLRFAKMDEPTIRLLAEKNLDKSGSYAIQRMNDRFVKELRGELDNVIGLPVGLVRKMIQPYRKDF